MGLVYALEAQNNDIKMFSIQPYDSLEYLGYRATVAQAYIPADQKETLRAMLHNPHSRLYEQPNPAVKALMSMIDPSIPLDVGGAYAQTGGSGSGGSSSGSGSNGGDSENNSNGDASDGGASSSGSTRPSSVGIGVGVVAGAAAYGAGMFWVARRYRKKRQMHRRASSTVDQMAETQGGSMFGGRISRNSDHSGSNRTQMISAPVMAENSLGWN